MTAVPSGHKRIIRETDLKTYETYNAKSPSNGGQQMAYILFVRAVSSLPADELERRMEERRPRFLEVVGLIQKIYSKDTVSGAFSGIYFFESEEALLRFRESDLAKTIASAYEVSDIRIETYEVMYPLRADAGPF
jgi:hypothetical protein